MNMSTDTREMDARLHEALYGVKTEMLASWRDPETGDWLERQTGLERQVAQHPEREYLPAELEHVMRAAQNQENHGIQYGMQPCAPRIIGDDLSSDWRAPFVGWDWEVIPHYSTDIAAAWQAEGDLPEDVRSEYVTRLRTIVADDWRATLDPNETRFRIIETYWLLRRATPAQMVQAMLLALEAREKQQEAT